MAETKPKPKKITVTASPLATCKYCGITNKDEDFGTSKQLCSKCKTDKAAIIARNREAPRRMAACTFIMNELKEASEAEVIAYSKVSTSTLESIVRDLKYFATEFNTMRKDMVKIEERLTKLEKLEKRLM